MQFTRQFFNELVWNPIDVWSWWLVVAESFYSCRKHDGAFAVVKIVFSVSGFAKVATLVPIVYGSKLRRLPYVQG